MPNLLLLLTLAAHQLAGTSQLPLDQSFDVNGVKIHYIVQGRGEPVVLIHGLHASAGINWQLPGVVGVLARNYRVIALDLPGHGESDKPETQAAYGVQMVEDVRELLDHLKIKKAHVVGYSLGGMITVKFLTLHQDRVRSAIVGGMGWFREGSGFQKIWEQMHVKENTRTPAACVHSLGRLAVTEKELKAIRVPVEVIVGDRDPVRRFCVAPLEQVRRDWPVIEIKNAGHLNCVVMPEFKDEIKKWLDKHAR